MLTERRSALQKDLGRLEAQMEMAATPKARGSHSSDRLLDLVRKMKVELARALDEDPRELHATVEGILDEIDSALGEEEEAPAEISDGLRREFEKVTKDFRALDAEISGLREKEQVFEKGQEGFYQMFKAAVADVQSAKNRIGEWENRNREFVLKKNVSSCVTKRFCAR